MRFAPYNRAKRACAAFTLAEVLAALVFMAIVIPVSVEALRIANLAGQVGERKAVAARIAERVLSEWSVTGQLPGTGQSGTVQEGAHEFRWSLSSAQWPQGTMQEVTVKVVYQVQGREYEVHISTLSDNSAL